MTFYELYTQDRERFMQAIEEQVNWARVALMLDGPVIPPRIGEIDLTCQGKVFAELRITLLDAIDELESSTDQEPASQAADDVIEQSQRQDGKA